MRRRRKARVKATEFLAHVGRESANIARILDTSERQYELTVDAQWEETVRKNYLRSIIFKVPMPPSIQALHIENVIAHKELRHDRLTEAEGRILLTRIAVMHAIYFRWCMAELSKTTPALAERIVRQITALRKRMKNPRYPLPKESLCFIGVGAQWKTLIVERRSIPVLGRKT